MSRVLLVEDHVIVRKGLVQLLSRAAETVELGEAGSAVEALAQLESSDWDVLVLDLSLPDRNGLELLHQIRREHPSLPIVILTMHPEDQLGLQAIRSGASAYLTKETAPEELVSAIRRVVRGGRWLTASLAEKLANAGASEPPPAPHELLSNREFQVFYRIAAGRTLKEIASELSLSAKTVTTYRTRVLEKMGMTSNAELTVYATRHLPLGTGEAVRKT